MSCLRRGYLGFAMFGEQIIEGLARRSWIVVSRSAARIRSCFFTAVPPVSLRETSSASSRAGGLGLLAGREEQEGSAAQSKHAGPEDMRGGVRACTLTGCLYSRFSQAGRG